MKHLRSSPAIDTDPVTQQRARELARAVPPPERLAKTLALSALIRDLAWQGALREAGDLDRVAVRDRFLRQLYGAGPARRIASQLSDPPEP